jgi:hypothetical protein
MPVCNISLTYIQFNHDLFYWTGLVQGNWLAQNISYREVCIPVYQTLHSIIENSNVLSWRYSYMHLLICVYWIIYRRFFLNMFIRWIASPKHINWNDLLFFVNQGTCKVINYRICWFVGFFFHWKQQGNTQEV